MQSVIFCLDQKEKNKDGKEIFWKRLLHFLNKIWNMYYVHKLNIKYQINFLK